MKHKIQKEAASLASELLDIKVEWFCGDQRLTDIIRNKSKQILINKDIICKDINITISNHKKKYFFQPSDNKKISFNSLDGKVKGSVLFPERSHGKEYDKYKLFMKNLILAQVA